LIIGGKELGRYIPEVLASMPDVNNLDRASKVLVGNVPDPLGPIAQHNFLLGPIPAALPSFDVETTAKQFGGFDCSGVGGRACVPNRSPFRIGRGLSEDRPQFDFPS